MKSIIATFLVLLSLSTVAYGDARPNILADQQYRNLYPYFVDGCSAGQSLPIGKKAGMPWGHGVLFLRGVEIDKSKSYPQLKLQPKGPLNEVGVSTDGQFSNINWVAVPGEQTFFYGDLDQHAVLTEKVKQSFMQKLDRQGWFSSIQSDRWAPLAKDDKDFRYLVLNEAIPIDVAITWSRQTICDRVPMTEKQMLAIISELNERNRFYFVDGHKFTWNFLSDNCGHTSQNVFAAAGILPKRNTDPNLFEKLPNIVVPSNFLIDLVRTTASNSVSSFDDLLNDDLEINTLMKFGTLRTIDGALTRKLPVHGEFDASLNELYDARDSKTTYLDIDILNQNKTVIERALNKPRFSDLKENLKYFLRTYQSRLEELRSVDLNSYDSQIGDYKVTDIYSAYSEFLKSKIRELGSKLSQLQ